MKTVAANFLSEFVRIGAALALVSLFLSAPMALAEEAEAQSEADPHTIVDDTTDDMFDVVREHKGETQSEAFYEAVTAVLEPVVDFRYIARVVMADHGEDASDEQIAEFAEVFKRGLVKTYARGIEGYVDAEVHVVEPDEPVGDSSRRVSVTQKVRDGSSTYELAYTMARNNDGEWKLLNVVLDGVNLGRSFRSQFAQAARKHEGDLDAVIDNWLDEI